MNVPELGSRWTWWQGALVGVVLAVATGVLGMHVLTAGHSAHGVGDAAHVSESASSDVPSPLAAFAPDDAAPHEAGGGATHVVASDPACDTDCTSGMGSVCLAVILLVLLLLHRHDHGRGSRQAARISLAHLVPALGVGPARPSLVRLCVSRT